MQLDFRLLDPLQGKNAWTCHIWLSCTVRVCVVPIVFHISWPKREEGELFVLAIND